MNSKIFLKWVDLLNLLEKRNPRALKYFYQFHTLYGLDERDMYPSERLQEIGDVSGDDYQNLLNELTIVAFPDLSEEQIGNVEREISDQGIEFIC
jgi:hypothetical protein